MNKSPQQLQTISFTVDGFTLRGVLHTPPKSAAEIRPAVVIGSHGLLADMQSPKQLALADRLTAMGLAYFRYDHRGCGGSEGEFARDTTLEARCRDLQGAIALMRSRPQLGNRVGLFGSSLGGAVSLAVAAATAVDALVTVAAPVSLMLKGQNLQPPAEEMRLSPEFYRRNLSFSIRDRLKQISRVLIIHGENDRVVPKAHAEEIYSHAGNPKAFILQARGDHRISAPHHQQQFLDEATAWFCKLLLD